MTIRPATFDDSDALLRWRNDADDYHWFRHPSAVTADEHRTWLTDRLAREEAALWILEVNDDPAGTVRLDVGNARTAVTSVSVAARYRGRGLARRMIDFVEREAAHSGVAVLEAFIHPDNAASHALFTSAGYVVTSRSSDGFVVYTKLVNQR